MKKSSLIILFLFILNLENEAQNTPTITIQPNTVSQSICYNSNSVITLTCAASNNNNQFVSYYEWYRNRVASYNGSVRVPGSSAKTNTLILSPNDTGAYYYYCKVQALSPSGMTISNLNVTTYRNGDPIINGSQNGYNSLSGFKSLKVGAYTGDIFHRVGAYSPDNVPYGLLYNWYAVNDPRGLAPEGFHIPTKDEFSALGLDYHYVTKNGAFYPGSATANGAYDYFPPTSGKNFGYWWTASPDWINPNNNQAFLVFMDDNNATEYLLDEKSIGLSVICLKDVPRLPSISIESTPEHVGITKAIYKFSVTNEGGADITARGLCWSTSDNPTTASSKSTIQGVGIGSFDGVMTNLDPNTRYFLRAYATNSVGTVYSNQLVITSKERFLKSTALNFTDLDNNDYPAIQIGTQIWSAKNLNVSRYLNGDTIPQITDTYQWSNTTSGAWCYYNNDPSTEAVYGKLYNWYAINDDRELAPTGWKISNDADWITLANTINSSSITTRIANTALSIFAGAELKETGISHWTAPNLAASNYMGFLGLPGGFRNVSGSFEGVNNIGVWWSKTESAPLLGSYYYLNFQDNTLRTKDANKGMAMSVRLVKK